MQNPRFFQMVMTWLAAMLSLYSLNVHAQEAVTDHVHAALVASVDAVYPGAEILLGVHQRIIPHWHTYWQNSGDSGIPTTIEWKLPEDAAAGEIQWPIPTSFNVGPVSNYGYANEVTLLTKVKVPQHIAIGGRFPIRAKVNWLVCADICVPEEVELSIDLPVVADANSAGLGSPLIKKAQAALPVDSPWPVSYEIQQQDIVLRIADSEFQPNTTPKVSFFPAEWGRIVHHADQVVSHEGKMLVLRLKQGESPLKTGEKLSGVLVVTESVGGQQVSRGFYTQANPILAKPVLKATEQQPVVLADADHAPISLPTALLLALLGGIVLNLMPCVFPVLSIKALSLMQHVHQSPVETRLHGVAYTLGTLVSFSVLGGLLIALKAGGAQIGWGFQFQSPVFVLIVAYLMFAVGLSLSGVFEIGHSVAGVGSALAERSGYSGSFFTGVLATIVATPCTAPFMGAAIGFALTQPGWILITVFLSLGLGLALPYLLLTFWPLLQRWLPRPGAWMERVKQVLAFPMYLAAVWLVWVLAQQAGANAVAIALAGMVAIAFAAWLYSTTRASHSLTRHGYSAIAGLAVLCALIGGYAGIKAYPANAANHSEQANQGKNWEPYTEARLQSLLTEGKPVFVNLTAAWCISCLANERVALSDPKVIETFKTSGITYLKGDWTNQDAQITRILKQFGRSGVPLYISYPATPANRGQQAAPQVLPQILTPDIVLSAVKHSLNPT